MPTPQAIAFFARVRAERGLKQKLERDPSPANLVALAAAAGYVVAEADAAELVRQLFGTREGEAGEDQLDSLRDQDSPPTEPDDEKDQGG